MPARHSDQTKVRTKLAELRVDRGIPQKAMAELLGMGLTAYQKLERGDDPNPRLRHLVNAAQALNVDLDELIEDTWRQWLPVPGHADPPARGSLWHTAPSSPVARTRAEQAQRPLTEREALEAMARRGREERERS